MMKDTVEKVKFKVLVRRLAQFGENERSVIGLLELLWRHTAIDAPQGNIGKLSDEEIAAVLQFNGPPEELVESLVQSGWLDRCEANRLVVHDWAEHCPRWVSAKLSREQKGFAKIVTVPTVERTTVPTTVPTVVASTVPTTERSPLLSSPSHSIPNQEKSVADAPRTTGGEVSSEPKPDEAKQQPRRRKPKSNAFTVDEVSLPASIEPLRPLVARWLDAKGSGRRGDPYTDRNALERILAKYDGYPEMLSEFIDAALQTSWQTFHYPDQYLRMKAAIDRQRGSPDKPSGNDWEAELQAWVNGGDDDGAR